MLDLVLSVASDGIARPDSFLESLILNTVE